jgi:LmbE family N-acetylglucosaminyl deacetylase
LATRREDEQRAAARFLGVQNVIFLRHPDGILENSLALRQQLAALLRKHKPHIVLTIDPWRHYQLHPDHRAAGQAALDAIWAAREWHIFAEQLNGEEEPWRVKEVYLFWTDNADYWEDIAGTVEARIDALMRHASQVGADKAKLAERIKERARKTGEKLGYEYAEEFKRFQF